MDVLGFQTVLGHITVLALDNAPPENLPWSAVDSCPCHHLAVKCTYNLRMQSKMKLFTAVVVSSIVVVGCGGDNPDEAEAVESEQAETAEPTGEGIRLVSVSDAASIQDNPSEDLVILDVRTPEEFAEGHLDGAIMIDFYRDDFAEQLAELDPDVPYLLYCRSGNRSGQTTALMNSLGFTDVADVDGGIVGWLDAGLPLVTD